MSDAEFEELYRRYGYFVQGRCRALLGDTAEAEDAVQEVFLRAFRLLNPSDNAGGALAWLYATASHYCCDLARRRKQRAKLQHVWHDSGSSSEGRPDLPGDPRRLLQVLVGDLDPTTYEIGVLHLLDGFTQEEVAVRTGFSRRTVGKRLKDIQQLLQDRLLPQDIQ